MSYRLEDLGCGEGLREILQEEISGSEIAAIESTIRPFIEITTVAAKTSAILPWQSRFGGMPYLPLGTQYPFIESKPAPLVAQINFAEVPPLEGFPTKGILQFYVVDKPPEEWNRSWMDIQTPNALSYDEILELAGVKILFFPDPILAIDALITDFSFLPEFEYSLVPTIHYLSFQRKLAPMNEGALASLERLQENEYFFENYDAAINEIWQQSQDDSMLEEALHLLRGDGHKLGGYPAFRQSDPRVEIFPSVLGETGEPYELLFCMEGESTMRLHDSKIYFLIQSSDLQRQDFSKVLFYGDR